MTRTGVLEPTGPNRSFATYRRPDPLDARTPAEFTMIMRRYLVWAGDWSYQELEYLCGGLVSARSFQQVLEGNRLPRYVLLMAFVTACVGEDEAESRRWLTAWRILRGRIGH